MLIDQPSDGQVGRDRVSFFIFPRSEVAPVVYDYAYTMVEGKTPADMPGVLRETFTKAVEGSRANPPTLVGSGYYALMELGEFAPSRIVEGGRPRVRPDRRARTRDDRDTRTASRSPPGSWTSCSRRRTVGGRPSDLSDDLAWVRAASGRAPHDDPRLPLIG